MNNKYNGIQAQVAAIEGRQENWNKCYEDVLKDCLNEKLEPVEAQVLVGQAVDTVGQTGNPRTVTGFQIHKSPALLAAGERSELSGEDYVSYSDVMENIVIVKEKEKKEIKK